MSEFLHHSRHFKHEFYAFNLLWSGGFGSDNELGPRVLILNQICVGKVLFAKVFHKVLLCDVSWPERDFCHYYTHFEITGGPCNLIGCNWCDLSTLFFYLNCIFFPGNEEATLKTKRPIRFQGLFKVTNQIAEKWKTKSIMWQILQLLFPKLLPFSPQEMDEFSDWFSTASIKCLNWPSPVFGWFQNGCNKVVIEPRVV